MSKEFKKYKARIFGELYPIISDEEESFIVDVIHKVDSLMKDIAEKSDSVDTKKIAVLAALKASEELLVLQKMMQLEKYQSNKIMALLAQENITL